MTIVGSIDRDKVVKRLMRGAFTGAGAVVSGSVGNLIAGRVSGSDFVVSAGEIALGASLSVFADELVDDKDSIPNDAIEFFGYGMQAVGWDEAFEALELDNIGGGGQSRVVDVRGNKSAPQASTNAATTHVG